MIHKLKMIYLLFILTLNYSCIDKKESIKSELVSNTYLDSLKFSSGINSMLHDSNGNFWFGSKEEGVSIFDGQSFDYLTVKEGLPSNQIRSIQEDGKGNIWFETEKGVSRFDGKNFFNYDLNEKIGSQNEWAKNDDDLWFSARPKEGIYRFDGLNLNFLAFPTPKVINPYSEYSVTCISEGASGMLWIGTYPGVFGYDGKHFTIINDETLNLVVETEPLHIRSILEDSKGRLWIGNNGIGVLLNQGGTTINFSEKNNLIHPTSIRKGDRSPPGTLEHVFAIEEDGEGNIWFGDRDTGVWKYDGDKMQNYTDLVNQSNDFARTIYKDHNDELWFIMTNGSLFKFKKNTFVKQF